MSRKCLGMKHERFLCNISDSITFPLSTDEEKFSSLCFFFAIYELFSWHCNLSAVCHKDFSVLCTCVTDYNIVIICFFAFRPFSGKEENTLRAKNQNLLSEVIFLQPAAASSTDGMGGSMSVASSSTGDNRY